MASLRELLQCWLTAVIPCHILWVKIISYQDLDLQDHSHSVFNVVLEPGLEIGRRVDHLEEMLIIGELYASLDVSLHMVEEVVIEDKMGDSLLIAGYLALWVS